jgi:hypothetical protein
MCGFEFLAVEEVAMDEALLEVGADLLGWGGQQYQLF